MTKLVLHLGLHKTGTSAIQRALHKNRELLRTNGIYYPDTGSFEAHHAVASRLKQSCSDTDTDAVADIERTFGYWRKTDCSEVIVSSEIFSECGYVGSLRVLRNLYSDIEIVFYVRRQDLLLESAYGQLIKQNGEVKDIDSSSPYFLDFHSHIMKFVSAIEPDKVSIRKYEKGQMFGGDAAKDFLHCVVGFDKLDLCEFDPPVNKSLSLVGAEFMRHMNKFDIEDRNSFVLDVIQSCDQLGGKFCTPLVGNLLTSEKRRQILQSVAESNEKLWRDFGLQIDEFDGEDQESVGLRAFSVQDAFELATIFFGRSGLKV